MRKSTAANKESQAPSGKNIKDRQKKEAAIFLALHQTPPLLVLPNAWDIPSAKIFEIEGFKAIGMTIEENHIRRNIL